MLADFKGDQMNTLALKIGKREIREEIFWLTFRGNSGSQEPVVMSIMTHKDRKVEATDTDQAQLVEG